MTTLHSRSSVDVRCVLITTPVVSEACSIVDHMAAVTCAGLSSPHVHTLLCV